MSDSDAYAPPQSEIKSARRDLRPNTVRLIKSQKLILWSILLNIAGSIIQMLSGAWLQNDATLIAMLIGAGVIAIASLVMAVFGIVRMCSSMGVNGFLIFLLVLLMLVPIVNLVVLVILNGRATRRIRDAGYSVGLFGVPASQLP